MMMSANRFSGNTVGFAARGDTAQITNGTIVTDDTSGGVAIVGAGDTVNYAGQGLTTASSFYGKYCYGACPAGLSNLTTILNGLGGNVNDLRWTGH